MRDPGFPFPSPGSLSHGVLRKISNAASAFSQAAKRSLRFALLRAVPVTKGYDIVSHISRSSEFSSHAQCLNRFNSCFWPKRSKPRCSNLSSSNNRQVTRSISFPNASGFAIVPCIFVSYWCHHTLGFIPPGRGIGCGMGCGESCGDWGRGGAVAAPGLGAAAAERLAH